MCLFVCNMSHVRSEWLCTCDYADRMTDKQTDKHTKTAHENEALEFKHWHRSCDVAPPIRNRMHTSTFIDQTISSIIQKYFIFALYLSLPFPTSPLAAQLITICVFLSLDLSLFFGESKSILLFEIYDANWKIEKRIWKKISLSVKSPEYCTYRPPSISISFHEIQSHIFWNDK